MKFLLSISTLNSDHLYAYKKNQCTCSTKKKHGLKYCICPDPPTQVLPSQFVFEKSLNYDSVQWQKSFACPPHIQTVPMNFSLSKSYWEPVIKFIKGYVPFSHSFTEIIPKPIFQYFLAHTNSSKIARNVIMVHISLQSNLHLSRWAGDIKTIYSGGTVETYPFFLPCVAF